MLSENELKDLYDRELKGLLQTKGGLHNKSRIWSVAAILSFLVIILSLFFHLPPAHYSIWLFYGSLAAVLIFTCYMSVRYYGAYIKWYKKEIVGRVLKAINPDWQYFPDHTVAQQDYLDARLFKTNPDTYKGQDLVVGVFDSISFKCSELQTEELIWEGTGNNSRSTRSTIFNGVFFHSTFNTEFPGSTYILPANPSKFSIHEWLKRDREIKDVGSQFPEFKGKFLVYSSNLEEAKSIITPAVKDSLVSLKAIHDRNINISVIKSKVSVAVEIKDPLFEPNILRSTIETSDIRLLCDVIQINELLIRNLDLNRKDEFFNPVKA